MKRLVVLTFALLFGLFCTCAVAQEKVKTKDDKVKMKNMDASKMDMAGMPYTAMYSSHFQVGNPMYAKMILDLWKDWDDNTFGKHNYMADSLVMMFPDGAVVKGKQASMDAATKIRGGMTSAKSVVHAWLPLRSTDRNEDLVCIWGSEEDVMPDGKIVKKDIHEVWWLNKDGKVYMMRQWAANFGQN